jgi:hypothetical protein
MSIIINLFLLLTANDETDPGGTDDPNRGTRPIGG